MEEELMVGGQIPRAAAAAENIRVKRRREVEVNQLPSFVRLHREDKEKVNGGGLLVGALGRLARHRCIREAIQCCREIDVMFYLCV